MPKKIYDVVPPKLARKIESDIKEYFEEEKKHHFKEAKVNRYKRSAPRRPAWMLVSIAVGVVALAVGAYLFFKLPRADINIWPKVEVLSFQQEVTADEAVDLTDIGESVVPAKLFEISKTLSEEFPATGNATDEGKASGTITVYNKSDPVTSVTLKAGTHFLSDSGKLFRASEKIIVPAGKKSGGKVTPGSATVKVEAVEGGDAYNIPPSDFSVPGLKGTSYYYSVYASSASAMSGGFAGKIKKVTPEDIQNAKESLEEKVKSEASSGLRAQISEDYILLDDAISSKLTNSESKTKSGTVADSFEYEASVDVSALAFKKSDIEEYAKKYIISQMPEGMTILDTSLKTSYSAVSADMGKKKIVIKLDFSAGIYKSVDKNSISLSLSGKNISQINETISGIMGDQLSKVDIKLWPFWVSKAPKNQKAVHVILMFE